MIILLILVKLIYNTFCSFVTGQKLYQATEFLTGFHGVGVLLTLF